MENRWMRYQECSQYTQLAPATLRRYVLEKRIPYCKVSGCIIFDRKAIDEWIEARAVPVVDMVHKKAPLDMEKLSEVMGE